MPAKWPLRSKTKHNICDRDGLPTRNDLQLDGVRTKCVRSGTINTQRRTTSSMLMAEKWHPTQMNHSARKYLDRKVKCSIMFFAPSTFTIFSLLAYTKIVRPNPTPSDMEHVARIDARCEAARRAVVVVIVCVPNTLPSPNWHPYCGVTIRTTRANNRRHQPSPLPARSRLRQAAKHLAL